MDKGLGHTCWVPVYDKRTGNKFVRRVKYVEFCQVTYFHMQILLHSYCITLSYFGTSKLPISGPNLGCLRQNFSFDFTVVILLSKFLEKPNKVRA